MKNHRTLKGFVLSFLLHLLIFFLFFYTFEKVVPPPPSSSSKVTKMTLNLSRFQPPAPPPAQPQPNVPSKRPIQPPKPKEIPSPKPVVTPAVPQVEKPRITKKAKVKEKKGLKVAKSPDENNATKIAKKSPKKPAKPKKHVVKHTPPKKKHHVKKKKLPKHYRLPKRSKDKLANALLGGTRSHRASKPRRASSSAERMIRQLYGKEFYRFTKTQQKFIRNNLSEIYRITQNTLYMNGYPEVAVRTRQQGVNVVSFYLHPNGDISNLRLVKPMGYEALDKNTIAVIQIAYKDYPHPKTKTKIIFYVNYQLY